MRKRVQVQCGYCGDSFLKLKSEVNRSKNHYCSSSCSAEANNAKRSKRIKEEFYKLNLRCECCNEKILIKDWDSLTNAKKRRYCSKKCQYKNQGLRLKKKSSDLKCFNKTKGQIFKECSTWQSARTVIRKLSQKIFEESGKPKKCVICNYNKHIEVAHIVAVSDFDESTPLNEICKESNLVALCPNHHWELDNGKLKI